MGEKELAASLIRKGGKRNSGYYVLLKKEERGFSCLGIVNPEYDDQIRDDFDLCVPIPVMENAPEFEGW